MEWLTDISNMTLYHLLVSTVTLASSFNILVNAKEKIIEHFDDMDKKLIQIVTSSLVYCNEANSDL